MAELIKVGELCDISSSKRIFAKEYQKSGIPFFRGKEVTEKYNGKLDVTTELFISEEKYSELESKFGVPNKGDMLLTSVGTLGSTYIVKESDKFYFKDGNLTWFKNFRNLNSHYLQYWLESPEGKAQLRKSEIGSSQSAYTIANLKEMQISLPLIDEQLSVVRYIKRYDNLIANNNRRIAILEDMAQSLYREWFVSFRYPNYQDNLDADGKPKLIDSPLGQIPEGWEVKRLDDYVTLQRGFDLPKAKRNNEGDVPIYAASGLTGYHDEIKAKGPGVVTGRSGTLGIVKLVLEDHWPLNTSLWVKKFENCTAHYAYYLLDSIGLERFNSGASVPTLNRNDVHGNPVIAPPIELINKFEEIVAVKHKQINILKRKNTNLKHQRDMLLPKLISGQIEL